MIAGPNIPGAPQITPYARLLATLDAVVSEEIDAAIAALPYLSEPLVARHLSRALPRGHGLFLGNSMPIRDMEMYGTSGGFDGLAAGEAEGQQQSKQAQHQQQLGRDQQQQQRTDSAGSVGLGVPIAANRGASGIDGVLSTAAGETRMLGEFTVILEPRATLSFVWFMGKATRDAILMFKAFVICF